MSGQIDRADVVIVGAGPAGLALAIELGRRSISCVVIEKNDRVGYAPRAKTTNARTRAHLRRWGIADKLADASPFGIHFPTHVIFVTRLAGDQIARFEWALGGNPARDDRYPEHAQWIPQYKLEAVMLEYARSLPTVEFLFETEYLYFEQSEHTVRVRIRDQSRKVRWLEAKYLVGADGARSLVREQIGAKMVGQYGLSRNYNTIFAAPGLAEAHAHGKGIMYWQLNQDVPSMIGPMDEGDLWFFMPTGIPEGVTYTPEQTRDLIRRSTGIDLPYKVLSSDEWTASRLLADRYALGRVFLTGDACHLHPPFGGYGMNMGVADSVDLGWKIAAVLEGWAHASILESYETERRPAHNYVMDEAQANHAISPNQLARDNIEAKGPTGDYVRQTVAALIKSQKTSEFFGSGVVLGYCYRGSPIIIDDGTQKDWVPDRDYKPCATPGCLAPHYWLPDGGSLYDLFGDGFTLLATGDAGKSALNRARTDADMYKVPLKIVQIGDESIRQLYRASLVLIRPDQVIAWRGERWTSEILAKVTSWK